MPTITRIEATLNTVSRPHNSPIMPKINGPVVWPMPPAVLNRPMATPLSCSFEVSAIKVFEDTKKVPKQTPSKDRITKRA